MGIRRLLVIGTLVTAILATGAGVYAYTAEHPQAPAAQAELQPAPVQLPPVPDETPFSDTTRVRPGIPAPDPAPAPTPVPPVETSKPAPEPSRPAAGDGGKTPPAPPPAPSAEAQPIYRVATEQKEVVLTFDDGPSNFTTPILAILQQEHVPAAFFWISGNAGTNLAPEVLKAGNQLGTHTISHPLLTKLDAAGQKAQLTGSVAVLTKAGGADIHYFRPPYGAHNADTRRLAAELHLSVILWNVDSRDWALADHPEAIVTNVMAEVKPGSIILLHERSQTVKMLPAIIKSLRDAGYSFRLLPAAN